MHQNPEILMLTEVLIRIFTNRSEIKPNIAKEKTPNQTLPDNNTACYGNSSEKCCYFNMLKNPLKFRLSDDIRNNFDMQFVHACIHKIILP